MEKEQGGGGCLVRQKVRVPSLACSEVRRRLAGSWLDDEYRGEKAFSVMVFCVTALLWGVGGREQEIALKEDIQ